MLQIRYQFTAGCSVGLGYRMRSGARNNKITFDCTVYYERNEGICPNLPYSGTEIQYTLELGTIIEELRRTQ